MLLEVLEASRCFHQSGFKPAAFSNFATGAQSKWGGEDSNLRSLSARDLQSRLVDHLSNLPKGILSLLRLSKIISIEMNSVFDIHKPKNFI